MGTAEITQGRQSWDTCNPRQYRQAKTNLIFVARRQPLASQVKCIIAGSEVERHLQINTSIGRGRREEPACQGIRLAKQRRLQNTDRRREVHVVENISIRRREV